jgi:TIR domain
LAVHREDELPTVEQSLETRLTRLKLRAQTTTTEALMRLPRGTVLEVEPILPGMLISPRRAEVVWLGMATIADFEMRTLHDDTGESLIEGGIEITTQEGLVVGRTPVAFRIMSSGDSMDVPELNTSRLIDRVFASYAHQDEAVVLACRAAYQGIGIQMFIDNEDIGSGEVWREALAKAIGRCDLFQLFWSEVSAASDEVKKEWKLALGIAPQKHKNFVRPVHWRRRSPVPNPPPIECVSLSVPRLEPAAGGGGAGRDQAD